MLVALSWFTRGVEPEWISLVILGLAYVAIIFAFWVDIVKIKKIMRKYQQEMAAKDAAERKKKYKGLSKKEIAAIEEAEIAQIKEAQEKERQSRKDKLKFWKKDKDEAIEQSDSDNESAAKKEVDE